MRLRRELGTAFAVVSAIVGAGFASGREIVTFFTCAGWASWLGVAAATGLLGALTAMLAALARRGGARSFPGIYAAAMGRECGEAIQLLHGVTMLLTATVMLAAGGELGALALPFRYAYPIALAATLLLGLVLARRDFRLLQGLGALLAPAMFVYYLCLALDGSPAPRPYLAAEVTVDLSGNVVAACFLGALYAALNAAMSGGVLAALAHGVLRPRRVGLLTGALLLALLVPANAALLRAGEGVRALALPGVVLAARWGTTGFYASVLVMWLSVLSTLAAALGSLRGQAAEVGLKPRLAVLAASLAALCLSVVGFQPLVRVGYPVLGWICAVTLLALVPFLREDEPADSVNSSREG